MFSKQAVRSVQEIRKGLLSRAFKRGGRPEYEKMKLLIEWRLAATHHYADKSLQAFEDQYRVEEFKQGHRSDSRGVDAFNFIAHIEGRKDRLHLTASYEDQIKALKEELAARQPHVDRWNAVMDIIWKAPQFDLQAIRNNQPNAPIIVDRTPVLYNRRSPHDPVWQEVPEPRHSYGCTDVRQRLSDGDIMMGDIKPPNKFNIH